MTGKTDTISSLLMDLQVIDQKIQQTRDKIGSFEPLLAEVDEPALTLEKEVTTTTGRVQELRLDERRLELAVEEKQARVDRLEERLNQVRNVREEAAVQAELGLVRRALESETQEAVSLLDQINRFEERLDEQKIAFEDAKATVEPRRLEILSDREEAQKKLESLTAEREAFASNIDGKYRKVYDTLIQGGRRVAVAPMTDDGACGACFSLIPLQVQHEIRTTVSLVLCESCGVIVTAPLPEGEVPPEAPPEEEAEPEAEDGSSEDGDEEEPRRPLAALEELLLDDSEE